MQCGDERLPSALVVPGFESLGSEDTGAVLGLPGARREEYSFSLKVSQPRARQLILRTPKVYMSFIILEMTGRTISFWVIVLSYIN